MKCADECKRKKDKKIKRKKDEKIYWQRRNNDRAIPPIPTLLK